MGREAMSRLALHALQQKKIRWNKVETQQKKRSNKKKYTAVQKDSTCKIKEENILSSFKPTINVWNSLLQDSLKSRMLKGFKNNQIFTWLRNKNRHSSIRVGHQDLLLFHLCKYFVTHLWVVSAFPGKQSGFALAIGPQWGQGVRFGNSWCTAS